jgi:hypothetical protein
MVADACHSSYVENINSKIVIKAKMQIPILKKQKKVGAWLK